jgi:hypothetical protein
METCFSDWRREPFGDCDPHPLDDRRRAGNRAGHDRHHVLNPAPAGFGSPISHVLIPGSEPPSEAALAPARLQRCSQM